MVVSVLTHARPASCPRSDVKAGDYPYSPRWEADELVRRIRLFLKEKLSSPSTDGLRGLAS